MLQPGKSVIENASNAFSQEEQGRVVAGATCENPDCQKRFEKARPWQRFCCSACRSSAHRRAAVQGRTGTVTEVRALAGGVWAVTVHTQGEQPPLRPGEAAAVGPAGTSIAAEPAPDKEGRDVDEDVRTLAAAKAIQADKNRYRRAIDRARELLALIRADASGVKD